MVLPSSVGESVAANLTVLLVLPLRPRAVEGQSCFQPGRPPAELLPLLMRKVEWPEWHIRYKEVRYQPLGVVIGDVVADFELSSHNQAVRL